MKQPDKDASPRNSATSLRREAAWFTAGRLARAAERKTEGRASAAGAVKELLQGDSQSLANDLQRVQIRAPLTTFPAG